jgi:hypothetical protein
MPTDKATTKKRAGSHKNVDDSSKKIRLENIPASEEGEEEVKEEEMHGSDLMLDEEEEEEDRVNSKSIQAPSSSAPKASHAPMSFPSAQKTTVTVPSSNSKAEPKKAKVVSAASAVKLLDDLRAQIHTEKTPVIYAPPVKKSETSATKQLKDNLSVTSYALSIAQANIEREKRLKELFGGTKTSEAAK